MSVAAEGRRSPPRRVLGFWMCLALVMKYDRLRRLPAADEPRALWLERGVWPGLYGGRGAVTGVRLAPATARLAPGNGRLLLRPGRIRALRALPRRRHPLDIGVARKRPIH